MVFLYPFLSYAAVPECNYLKSNNDWDGLAYSDYKNNDKVFYAQLDACKNVEGGITLKSSIDRSIDELAGKVDTDKIQFYNFNKSAIKYLADKNIPEFQYYYGWLHNAHKTWVGDLEPKDYYTYIFWLKRAASKGDPNALFALAKLSSGVYMSSYESPEAFFFPFFTLSAQQSFELIKTLQILDKEKYSFDKYELESLKKELSTSSYSGTVTADPVKKLNINVPYKKPIWLKGQMGGDNFITMVLYENHDSYSGHYFYDKAYKKWGSSFSVKAKIINDYLHVDVFDEENNFIEKFELLIKGKKNNQLYYLEGNWRAGDKSLPVKLGDLELYDDEVTCQEMELAPDMVFTRPIDFGSGHSDQDMSVDSECKRSVNNIDFMKKAYDLADSIRLDPMWGMGCGGTSVYPRIRHVRYELAKAGYAPEIYYADHNKEFDKNRINLDYWKKKESYNKNTTDHFFNEIEVVKQKLKYFYINTVVNDDKKADLYTSMIIESLMQYAVGGGEVTDGMPYLITVFDDGGIDAIMNAEWKLSDYRSALGYALLNSYPETLIELLLKNNKDLNYGEESPLFYALHDRKQLTKLLDSGADINYQNSFGKTVIFYAVQNDDVDLVKFLINRGANIHHRYKTKEDYKNSEDNSMNSFCIQHKGRTLLMHAAQHSSLSLLKYLVEKGVDFKAVDDLGDSAERYAEKSHKKDNYDYLKSIKL